MTFFPENTSDTHMSEVGIGSEWVRLKGGNFLGQNVFFLSPLSQIQS
jgi:hypothetical protein